MNEGMKAVWFFCIWNIFTSISHILQNWQWTGETTDCFVLNTPFQYSLLIKMGNQETGLVPILISSPVNPFLCVSAAQASTSKQEGIHMKPPNSRPDFKWEYRYLN